MRDWSVVVALNLDVVERDGGEAARRLLALWWLIAEWRNGGIDQYLFNSAADTLPEVRSAFEDAGFVNGLEWLDGIATVMGGSVPLDRDSRIDKLVELRGDPALAFDPFEAQEKALKRLLLGIEDIAEGLMKAVKGIDRARRSASQPPSGVSWNIPDGLKG